MEHEIIEATCEWFEIDKGSFDFVVHYVMLPDTDKFEGYVGELGYLVTVSLSGKLWNAVYFSQHFDSIWSFP